MMILFLDRERNRVPTQSARIRCRHDGDLTWIKGSPSGRHHLTVSTLPAHGLHVLWYAATPVQRFLDVQPHRIRGNRLAVRDIRHLRRPPEMAKPAQHFLI